MASIANDIIIDIKNKIINNEYKVDAKIPSEHKLASMYNVSRTTIREVIHRLVEAGYLKTIVGSGSVVIQKENSQIISITPSNFIATKHEIYEIRKILEVSIMKDICNNINPLDIEYLTTLTKTMYQNIDNFEIIKNQSYLFHLKLAEISKNNYIKEILSKALYDFFNIKEIIINPKIELHYHQELIKKFLIKDYKTACSLMDVYLDEFI